MVQVDQECHAGALAKTRNERVEALRRHRAALGGKHLHMILYHREQSRYLLVFGPLLIYFDDRALSALWESMRLIDRMR
jgi:hypothetical protein